MKQLHLHLEGEVSDLVEEERRAVGQLEAAEPVRAVRGNHPPLLVEWSFGRGRRR